MKVTAFDHLVLRVADVERALGFYLGDLGLAPVRVEEWRRGEAPFPSVRVDAGTIIDIVDGDRSGTNVDHLCLVVDGDLDDIEATLGQGQRGTHLYGARGYADALYVTDPDGNTVELRVYA